MSKKTTETGIVGWAPAIGKAVEKFAAVASPEQMLELFKLAKEAREMENRAQLGEQAIDANKDLAMSAMGLRKELVDKMDRVLDRTDRNMDTLVKKMAESDDPEMIAALAAALANVASTDQLSAFGEMMAAVKADKVDLEF